MAPKPYHQVLVALEAFKNADFKRVLYLLRGYSFSNGTEFDRKILHAYALSRALIVGLDTQTHAAFSYLFENPNSDPQPDYWTNYLNLLMKHNGSSKEALAVALRALALPNQTEELACTIAKIFNNNNLQSKSLEALNKIDAPSSCNYQALMIEIHVNRRNISRANQLVSEHLVSCAEHDTFAINAIDATLRNLEPNLLLERVNFLTTANASPLVQIKCAQALEALGQTEKAVDLLRTVEPNLQTSREKGAFVAALAPHLDPKEALKHLNSAMDTINVKKQRAIHSILMFRKASTYERLNDTQRQVEALKLANCIEFNLRKPSYLSLEAKWDQSREVWERMNRISSASPELKLDFGGPIVFIVGLPRCGSTVVADYLYRHFKSRNCEEQGSINFLVDQLGADASSVANDKMTDRIRAYYDGLPVGTDRSILSADDLIIDKSLFNFLHLGHICKLFADIKIIWMSRNHPEHKFAMFKQFLSGSACSFCYDLDEIEKALNLQSRIKEFWRTSSVEFIEIKLEEFKETPHMIGDLMDDWVSVERRANPFNENHSRISMTASKAQIRQKQTRSHDEAISIEDLLASIREK